MIPIKLTLSNFLSYGEAKQTLDFRHFKIACLMGANGMGKSAVLDAITWALWGEARKASQAKNVKAAKYIVRNNASHAFVEFDFEVDGNFYRIKRTADVRAHRFTEKVYLQIIDADGNPQSELSDLNKNETDAKIVALLGLDYETFLNSAYLAQGKADEFTKKNAKDRVEIIRKVLNLDRYLQYEEEAKNRLQKIRGENRILIARMEQLETEIAEEGTRQAEFDEITQTLSKIQADVETQKKELKDLETQQADLHRQMDWVKNLQKNCQNLQQEGLGLTQEIEKNQQKISELEQLKSQEAEIKAQYLAYEAVRAQYEPLSEKQQQDTKFRNQLLQESHKLNEAQRSIETLLQNINYEKAQIKNKIDVQLQLAAKLKQAQINFKSCQEESQYLAEQEGKSAKIEDLNRTISSLQSSIEQQKKNLLSKITEKELLRTQIKKWQTEIVEISKKITNKEKDLITLGELEIQIEDIKDQGAACNTSLASLKVALEALDVELVKISKKTKLMADSPEGDCPTCGSKMTETHRAEMLALYAQEHHQIELQKQEKTQEQAAVLQKKADLAAQYKQAISQQASLKEIPTQLATLKSQLQQLEQRIAENKDFEESLNSLKSQLKDDFSSERKEILAKEAEIIALNFDKKRYEAAIAVAAKTSIYETQIEEAVNAQNILADLNPQFEELESQGKTQQELLTKETFGIEIREAIKTIEAKLKALAFDETIFATLKAEEQRLRPYRASFQAILGADGEIDGHRKITQNLQTQIQKIEEKIASLNTEISEKTISESTLSTLKTALESATQQLATTEEQERQTISKQSTIQEQLRVISHKKNELTEIQSQNQTLTKNIKIHEGLAIAFGRNGIPIIEIDRESPHIEAFANDILRTLRSRSSVRIVTQKDKADGSKMNALEIEITDDQANTRPYEMFSGGEAFRINFALRIALAYALAARKGIQLRTLIIDEGFGTLDQEGIHAMRDAIYAIQERFDKILIITHMEELKDAFPTRIEIYKDLSGSKFMISS